MYYKENLGYVYPEKSDGHMITVKPVKKLNFDTKYSYYQKSKWYKFKRLFLYPVLYLFAFPICTLRHGVKIHGRKEFKKNKKIFKDGAITISNHVLMWDYICVLKAIRPTLQYHMVWKDNVEGSNGTVIRWVGGIPVPTENIRSLAAFSKSVDDVLKDNHWLHVFPEGSMWFYYPDIRPLKPAVFRFAVKHNKPIIPITLSFRKRTGLWKLLGKKPLVDVNIGSPIYPDTSLPFKEAVDKIHNESYHIMQVMNGINPGDETYNIDQNINNYKKTM